MVIFNGNKLWHAVAPLEAGAERVVLTMEYVSNPEMSPFYRFVSHMKDAIAYFGFSALLRGGYHVDVGVARSVPPCRQPVVTALLAPETFQGLHSSKPLIRAIRPPPMRHT
jgi:hypothetical protein